jgi:hypothetical protein
LCPCPPERARDGRMIMLLVSDMASPPVTRPGATSHAGPAHRAMLVVTEMPSGNGMGAAENAESRTITAAGCSAKFVCAVRSSRASGMSSTTAKAAPPRTP